MAAAGLPRAPATVPTRRIRQWWRGGWLKSGPGRAAGAGPASGTSWRGTSVPRRQNPPAASTRLLARRDATPRQGSRDSGTIRAGQSPEATRAPYERAYSQQIGHRRNLQYIRLLIADGR